MNAATLALIRGDLAPKGDVLAAARVAGILAAKRTADLIPLCHPLPLSFAGVDFEFGDAEIIARAEVRTAERTGVEMEALTAVSVALLTIYDMAKSSDRAMEIHGVRLLAKTGGARGDYHVKTDA